MEIIMSTFKIFKETSLPGTLEANAMYLIAPSGKPNYVEIYITGTSASTVRRVLSEDDVANMITLANQTQNSLIELKVVNTIAERDALTPTQNILVLVKDATGDATVLSGAATYVYEKSNTSWTKISEMESMDVTLSWANLVGKPTSTSAEIDDAVLKKHSHANITQLNQIGEDGSGNLTYNGLNPRACLDSVNW